MDISRNKTTGKIIKGSLSGSFRKGEWEGCLDKNSIIAEFQNYIDEDDLSNAKLDKIQKIKQHHKSLILSKTPQTVGAYSGNLENKEFKIKDSEKEKINSIINKLQKKIDAGEVNPTRKWTSTTGRIKLFIEDFRSLLNHLDDKDEQQYDQVDYKLRIIQDSLDIDFINNFDSELDIDPYVSSKSYQINSFVYDNDNNDNIYKSLVVDNSGNDLTDTNFWKLLPPYVS